MSAAILRTRPTDGLRWPLRLALCTLLAAMAAACVPARPDKPAPDLEAAPVRMGGAVSGTLSLASGAITPAQGTAQATDTGSTPTSTRVDALEMEVRQLREELDRMRPALNRMLRLEGDIQTVLRQVEQVLQEEAGAPAAPVSPPVRTAAVPVPAPEPPRPLALVPLSAEKAETVRRTESGPPPVLTIGRPDAADVSRNGEEVRLPVPPVRTADGGFWIHVGTFSSERLAHNGWKRLQAQYAALLGPLGHKLQRFTPDGSRGVLFRVLAGGFDSRGAAMALCERLRQDASYGKYCKVMEG